MTKLLSSVLFVATVVLAAERDRFLGVWKLKSYESRYSDGRVVQPYGPNPVGRITYDRAGRMSAQLMNPDRNSKVVPSEAAKASEADLREILRGAISYYGTFTVDEKSGTVQHKVEFCNFPAWVGTDQIRRYQFGPSGLLTLRVTRGDAENVLVWEKQPD